MEWPRGAPQPTGRGQVKQEAHISDADIASAAALAAAGPDPPQYNRNPQTYQRSNGARPNGAQPKASAAAAKGMGSFAGITLFTHILKRTTNTSLHTAIDEAVQSFVAKYRKLTQQSHPNQSNHELFRARSQYSRELLVNFQNICGEESIIQAVTEFKSLNEKNPHMAQRKSDPTRRRPSGAAESRAPRRGSRTDAESARYMASQQRMQRENPRHIAGQYGRLIKAWNHACTCNKVNCTNDVCAKIKPSVMHQQQLKSKGLVGQCDPDCKDCGLYQRLTKFSSTQRSYSPSAGVAPTPQTVGQRGLLRSHSAGSHMYQLQRAEQQAKTYEQPYRASEAAAQYNNPRYQNGRTKAKTGTAAQGLTPTQSYGFMPKEGAPTRPAQADPDMLDVANLLGDESASTTPVKKEPSRAAQKRKASSTSQTASRAAKEKPKKAKKQSKSAPAPTAPVAAPVATPEDFADIFGEEKSVNTELKTYANEIPGAETYDVDVCTNKLPSKQLLRPASVATPDDFAQLSWL